MNHLDLFSGIGGFSLGLKKVFNIKHTYYSEIDKYAIDVYKHNFKNSTYVKSIIDVRGRDLPRIDVITFGSPCQDFSLAGKRKGMDGERSSLITEAIRLIKECRPRFFIWENVKGTFSSNSGSDFWAIIQAFTNIGGYRLEWQLLNTKWFLPQNRERIYLVGYIGNGSGRQIFPIGESYKRNFKERESSSCITTSYHKGVNFDNQLIKVMKHDIPEIVSVRKYKVNTKDLQKLLSNHKQKTIKQISKELNLPKTQVEHWFRKDKSFSIPPKDVWHRLKKVLNIKDNSFDKSITTYIEKESVFEKTNRVYDIKGIAPTLTSTSADEKIIVKSATKKGYETAKKGDSINYAVPTSKTRRGRVGKGVAQTLDTACNQAVLDNKIRRLTPIECERLQGFPDDWTKIGKELETISDSQRYKMCGNAVTVDVVEAVANKIKNVL
jgi:DNA (cytosine-5)-methyltransferase 1